MVAALRKTEQSIRSAKGIDSWEDAQILSTMVDGQERAIAAVRSAIPQIASAAQVLAKRLAAGGRVAYAGAGTSIRVAVQDGSELPATFGMEENRILYLIAGGPRALTETMADAEDDSEAGGHDARQLTSGDTLIAVAASGSTPYTIAAAHVAKANGTFVIAVINNHDTPLGAKADIEIILDSGPEVIAGSTRMGAGTAQKAALNMLSTLTHIHLGAVHDGLMVNVQAGNVKLKRRAAEIVAQISGASIDNSIQALEACDRAVKPAILICAGVQNFAAAQELLNQNKGILRLALAQLKKSKSESAFNKKQE